MRTLSAETSESPDRSVTAVGRTLVILDALIDRGEPLSLGDLEASTGLFKSVILRYMITLEGMGYVRKGANGMYEPGVRSFQLGCAFLRQFDMGKYVPAALSNLVEQTGESAFFSVKEGDERVCIYSQDSSEIVRANVRPGMRLPLDEAATSQIFRRYAAAAPARWSLDDVLHSSGLGEANRPSSRFTASVSAPVFKYDNTLVGALTIAGPIPRFDPGSPAILKKTLKIAADLSQSMGADIQPPPR